MPPDIQRPPDKKGYGDGLDTVYPFRNPSGPPTGFSALVPDEHRVHRDGAVVLGFADGTAGGPCDEGAGSVYGDDGATVGPGPKQASRTFRPLGAGDRADGFPPL